MITFSKDLLAQNPVYNNSVVEFSSNIADILKAVITVGGNSYNIYPINNIFYFNFKEIAKSIFNQNRFEDSIIPNIADSIFYSDDSILKSLTVNFKVISKTGVEDIIDKDYNFIRSVEQLPFYRRKLNMDTDVKALLPTKNFIDYEVTHFEGFPFDFTIEGLVSGDEFYFRNISTNISSEVYQSPDNQVKRIFLSDGESDTTIDDVLLLNSAVNRIELFKNGEFKCNFNIRKIESECGVYLKWANNHGGYSYWKFDKVWRENTSVKTIGEIAGDFDNLQNIYKNGNLMGKTSTVTMSLQSKIEERDREYVNGILESPTVQMYVHTSPFNKMEEFDFINVKVNDGSFPTANNKLSKSKINLTIEMPERYLMTL